MKKELDGLVVNGTLVSTPLHEVPQVVPILNYRVVDDRRGIGEDLKRRSGLVTQKYENQSSPENSNRPYTVQRTSKRLLLSLDASLHSTTILTRKLTQAYVQWQTPREITVFMNAPGEIGLPEWTVLKVVRSFCGIPESYLHWYGKSLDHHVNQLGMENKNRYMFPETSR